MEIQRNQEKRVKKERLLNEKIEEEERKLLTAQRKLESRRLLSALFWRIEVVFYLLWLEELSYLESVESLGCENLKTSENLKVWSNFVKLPTTLPGNSVYYLCSFLSLS